MFPVTWVGVVQFGAVTGQLAPEASTTICDEVGNEDDVVVHPVKVPSPIKLTTKRSMICRRQRFLSPTRHRMPASMVAANTGLEEPL